MFEVHGVTGTYLPDFQEFLIVSLVTEEKVLLGNEETLNGKFAQIEYSTLESFKERLA